MKVEARVFDKITLVILGGVLAVTVFAYRSVLFNFFCGDDFVHLEWLSRAVNHPDLIWRNFYSNWLDVPTCQFYRPLISIFMYGDYVLWRNNGLGFHLTNLTSHLISVVMLYVVLAELALRAYDSPSAGSRLTESVQHAVYLESPGLLDGSQKPASRGMALPCPPEVPCPPAQPCAPALPGFPMFTDRLSPVLALFDKNGRAWALASAALFALYPLHPEAVSWITGRVDTIVTMFFLASFACYLQARRTGATKLQCASLLFFSLALLSKEMAIIEPAVLVALEVLMPKASSEAVQKKFRLFTPQLLIKRFLPTLPFWLLLCGYFIVRRLALGTFVGGYDDSLKMPALSGTMASWLHALRIMFVPFNAELFGAHDLLKMIWTFVCLIAGALFVRRILIDRSLLSIGLFLVAWLFLSLVPVFRLLNIAGDLQGSRLVYMATAPICAILSFGCLFELRSQNAPVMAKHRANWLGAFVAVAIVSLAFFTLVRNNEPWRESGLQSQSILAGLNTTFCTSAGNPPTYFVGLPDSIHGAFLARNALDGMTRAPQIKRDAVNCFALNNFDPVFPFGFAKRAMESSPSKVRVFIWDCQKKIFAPYAVPDDATNVKVEKIWQKEQLKQLLHANGEDDRIPARAISIAPPELPCWPCEFVVIRLGPAKSSFDKTHCSLNYTNDLISRFDWRHCLAPYVHEVGDSTELAFPLHGEIDWAFGQRCREFNFISPQGDEHREQQQSKGKVCRGMAPPCPLVAASHGYARKERSDRSTGKDCILEQLRIEGPDKLLPKVTMLETGNQNKNGFIELTPQFSTCQISYDVSKMPGAVGIQLEVTNPNQYFSVHNSANTNSPLGISKILSGCVGTLTLKKGDFPKDGIYQARIRAVDQSRNSIGFASDHALITVRN